MDGARGESWLEMGRVMNFHQKLAIMLYINETNEMRSSYYTMFAKHESKIKLFFKKLFRKHRYQFNIENVDQFSKTCREKYICIKCDKERIFTYTKKWN